MTLDLLPNSLPGITFKGTQTPVFNSRVLTSRSGKEMRVANWPYPKWEFILNYEFLREHTTPSELDTLLGFVLSQIGQVNPFYYKDPHNYSVSSQWVGIGDGATDTFRLKRTIGLFIDLIYYSPTISAVYIDGVLQTTGWAATASGDYGNDSIIFTTPPAYGEVITADFEFYYVCRFKKDSQDFDQLFHRFWQLRELSFTTVF